MLESEPNGYGPTAASDLLARAHALLSSDTFEAAAVTTLARVALSRIRISHLLSVDPGPVFLAARLDDVANFLEILGGQVGVSRLSLGTLLLSVEFLLRTAQYQAGQTPGDPGELAG